MKDTSVARHDGERLATLDTYQPQLIVDRTAFYEVAALAASICGTPNCLVSLVHRDHLDVLAAVGWTPAAHDADTDTGAFCNHTVLSPDVFEVADTLADIRFIHHPLVTAGPRLRFYAGAPLLSPAGQILGSLCVTDVAPRQLTEEQRRALLRLANVVVSLLENIKTIRAATPIASLVEQTAREVLVIDSVSLLVLYANRAACDALGYTKQTIRNLPVTALDPDYLEWIAHFDATGLGRTAEPQPRGSMGMFKHKRSDGSTYPVEARLQRAHDGEAAVWLLSADDASERVALEESLTRSRRFFEVVAMTNHAIIDAETQVALFAKTCSIVVETGGAKMAWIGLVENDVELMPVASAGLPLETLKNLRYRLDDPLSLARSGSVRAAVTGETALIDNFDTAYPTPGWQEPYLAAGLRSAAAFPLKLRGKAIGTMCAAFSQHDFFDAELISLFEKVAENISLFLERKHLEAERAGAVAQVSRGEERYATLVDLFPESVQVYQDGVLQFINRAGAHLFGARDPKELIGQTYMSLFDESAHPVLKQRMFALKSQKRTPPLIYLGRKLDGSTFHMEVQSSQYPAFGKGAVLSVVRDVTERVLREAFISEEARILQMSASGAPLHAILDRLALLLTQQAPRIMPAIMLVNSKRHMLQLASAPTLPAALCDSLDGLTIGMTSGSCGAAAVLKREVVTQDIANDEHWRCCAATAATHGVLACWSTPVVASNGEVVGTFACYYRSATEPTDAERELLRALRGVAAVVIERDRADRRLVATRNRLLEAHSLARMGYWRYEIETDQFSASHLALQILGLPLHSRTISRAEYNAMIHPDDRARVAAKRLDSIRNFTPFHQHYRIIRPDGEIVYIDGRGTATFDEINRVTHFSGVIQDVTERHRSEQALRLRQHAVDATLDGIVMVDATHPNLPILYTNPGFESMTGYTAAEVLGRNCQFLQGPDTDQLALEEIRAALREQRPGQTILKNYRKDGSAFWNSLRIAPVRDENGVLTHYVGIQTDVSERMRYEEELARRANYDALTGLPNRALFFDRVQQVMLAASSTKAPMAVAFVDLDHFKVFNDSIGHDAGDQVLKTVAQRLREHLEEGETLARFGGDEFVILFPRVAHASSIESRLKAAMQNLKRPAMIAGQEVSIGASIGLAIYPDDADSAEKLVSHADFAMYRAKAEGRAELRRYDPRRDVGNARLLTMQQEMRRAIDQNEFQLHYQPRVDAESHEIVGFEALLRWAHPEKGWLPPLEFIPVAEETGLIVEIGEWVLNTACKQNQNWVASGRFECPVSVNVSVAQFEKTNFVEVVQRCLANTGLAPALLELEITESLVMEDPEAFIEVLKKLKALGVKIAIDDFGTGYSSLSYLKRFPIDHLKIDRSFVRDLATDPADASICRTIIAMAHSLEISVVAEGVETVEQAIYLSAHGCEELQGYLFYRPAPPETFDAVDQGPSERIAGGAL